MLQVYHSNARTNQHVRGIIQNSDLTNAELADKYNVSIGTISKWRNRDFTEDKSSRPNKIHYALTPLEKEAREKGIAFVQLDGNIGVIANGAGLTMATLDALNEFNGKGSVFLDLGGTDDPEKVKQALEIMVKAKPKVILINLFGGITKCDTVAKGIIEFLEKNEAPPIVARIKGVNEDVAREMLKDYVMPVETFEEAAKKAAELGG